ncbi:MAG: rhomboid family intramembrane serine protease [Pseudomonadota bacterium]
MSTNGSGKKEDKDKVVKFPTLGERDRMRREERAEEKAAQKAAKKAKANAEPFFNFGQIPPFAKTFFIALIVTHIILYVLLNDAQRLEIFYLFGFIPGMYTGAFPWNWSGLISPLSYALIHASTMHLVFNAIMGMALSIFFERLFSTRGAAIFFAGCTLCGALFSLMLAPSAIAPVIGASGGISGLFGALIYITMTQNTNHPLTQRLGKYGPWPVLIFWGLFITLPGLLFTSTLAWQAHLGGYVGGLALLVAWKNAYIRF